MDTHEKYAELAEVLRRHGVKIMYLFGSQKEAGLSFLHGKTAGGEKGSDLDIGVVFGSLPVDAYAVYGELYADLSALFEPFEIDLVFLQETTPLFQYDAVCGEPVYADDEEFLDEYEERIMKTASDLMFKKREFERDFLEAVKDGYFEITRR